jgi:hypothetical protein
VSLPIQYSKRSARSFRTSLPSIEHHHAWSHHKFARLFEGDWSQEISDGRYLNRGLSRNNPCSPRFKDGYDVYFVSDCSAGCSREAHEDAKVRMTLAGARPMSWISVQCEWAHDYTTPEKVATGEILARYGGVSALWIDYAAAQIKAGLVQVPEFMKNVPNSRRG